MTFDYKHALYSTTMVFPDSKHSQVMFQYNSFSRKAWTYETVALTVRSTSYI